MKNAVPNPVPSVMTASKPWPSTTAAPWTSASLATRHGLPIDLRRARRPGRSPTRPSTSSGSSLGPRALRRARSAARSARGPGGPCRGSRRDAVPLGQLVDQRGRAVSTMSSGDIGYVVGHPHPVGHGLAVLVEDVGLEAGAADVDGDREGVLGRRVGGGVSHRKEL